MEWRDQAMKIEKERAKQKALEMQMRASSSSHKENVLLINLYNF